MNKKIAVLFSVLVILAFIGYIIFDSARPDRSVSNENKVAINDSIPDAWQVAREFKTEEGSLKAVTVSPSGTVFLGGDSYVSSYDMDMKLLWNLKTPSPVTSLSFFGDTVFASTEKLILIINSKGELKDLWGPFEDSAMITSVSSNRQYVVVADAGNKILILLDKKGNMKKMVGQNDKQFVIPSAYFDVAIGNENNLFVANTGHHRIESRSVEGTLRSFFGEPGTAPGAFAGCCNPGHFILIPDGFVTAEKGINRIKILNKKGEFVEFVNSKNKFVRSVPLDLASADGKTIYAANPADSKLYIFRRK